MKQSFFLKTAIFIVLLIVGFVSNIDTTFASVNESSHGWLWGGGVTTNPAGYDGTGWWSMNNLNAPPSAVPFGVNIPFQDGDLSGYAWSEHYGWMSFNASDVTLCPAPVGGQCKARRVGNKLVGWARILSIRNAGPNSGGWSGWVALSSDGLLGATASFGVTINNTQLGGYAYSDELGWIDFSRVTIAPVSVLKICLNTCNGGVKVSDGVTRTINSNQDLYACLNASNACDEDSSPAASGTTWSSNNVSRLPVSSPTGGGTTAVYVSGVATTANITATLSGYTPAVARYNLPCDRRCQYPNRDSICPSEDVQGTDLNHCPGACASVPGAKDCNSDWHEVAP